MSFEALFQLKHNEQKKTSQNKQTKTHKNVSKE